MAARAPLLSLPVADLVLLDPEQNLFAALTHRCHAAPRRGAPRGYIRSRLRTLSHKMEDLAGGKIGHSASYGIGEYRAMRISSVQQSLRQGKSHRRFKHLYPGSSCFHRVADLAHKKLAAPQLSRYLGSRQSARKQLCRQLLLFRHDRSRLRARHVMTHQFLLPLSQQPSP